VLLIFLSITINKRTHVSFRRRVKEVRKAMLKEIQERPAEVHPVVIPLINEIC
jgi:hypothetical protein